MTMSAAQPEPRSWRPSLAAATVSRNSCLTCFARRPPRRQSRPKHSTTRLPPQSRPECRRFALTVRSTERECQRRQMKSPASLFAAVPSVDAAVWSMDDAWLMADACSQSMQKLSDTEPSRLRRSRSHAAPPDSYMANELSNGLQAQMVSSNDYRAGSANRGGAVGCGGPEDPIHPGSPRSARNDERNRLHGFQRTTPAKTPPTEPANDARPSCTRPRDCLRRAFLVERRPSRRTETISPGSSPAASRAALSARAFSRRSRAEGLGDSLIEWHAPPRCPDH